MGKIKKVILIVSIITFIFYCIGYCEDAKEEVKQYISKINPIIINVQITSRNVSQNPASLGPAVKKMSEYLVQLRAIKPPSLMAREHKMILLSFYKMKMGFYLLTKRDKITSVPLVRKGAELLKAASRDIIDFARKEGLIKEKDSSAKSLAPIENNAQLKNQ